MNKKNLFFKTILPRVVAAFLILPIWRLLEKILGYLFGGYYHFENGLSFTTLATAFLEDFPMLSISYLIAVLVPFQLLKAWYHHKRNEQMPKNLQIILFSIIGILFWFFIFTYPTLHWVLRFLISFIFMNSVIVQFLYVLEIKMSSRIQKKNKSFA